MYLFVVAACNVTTNMFVQTFVIHIQHVSTFLSFTAVSKRFCGRPYVLSLLKKNYGRVIQATK